MTATAKPSRHGVRGFTLIEVLAALAIGSAVIVATAALIHNVALNFDRRTGVVGRADQLLLAIERMAADFGAARQERNFGGIGNANANVKPIAAFVGSPTQVRFVAAGGAASGSQGEEVVSLTVEENDGATQLIRRRAAWGGPRTSFENVILRDPVQLIEGKVDIVFAYGSFAVDGTLSWNDSWTGQVVLPRLVRLTVRDRASGADIVPGVQFALRADAPIGCAQPEAKAECLTGSKPVAKDETKPTKSQPAGARG